MTWGPSAFEAWPPHRTRWPRQREAARIWGGVPGAMTGAVSADFRDPLRDTLSGVLRAMAGPDAAEMLSRSLMGQQTPTNPPIQQRSLAPQLSPLARLVAALQ